MKVQETVETLVIDLMVRGAVDQDSIRRSLRDLRFQLAEAGLDDILADLDQEFGVGESEREFVLEEVVRVLDTIYKQVAGGNASDKVQAQIEGAIHYDRLISPTVIQSFGDEFEAATSKAYDLLKKLASDNANRGMLEQLFGALHTTKGVSSLISAEQISELAHRAETVLTRSVRRGKIFRNERFLVQDAIDMLADMARQITEASVDAIPCVPQTHALIVERLDKMVHTPDANLAQADAEHEAATQATKPAQAVSAEPSAKAGQVEEEDASYDRNWSWQPLNDEEIAEYESVDAFRDAIGDDVSHETDEDSPSLNMLQAAHTTLRTGPPAAVDGFDEAQVGAKVTKMRDISEGTVRVPVSKLESLIDLLGELVIAETQVVDRNVITESEDLELQRQVAHLKRITLELQNRGVALRMFPMNEVMSLAAQAARKTASQTDKRIEVKTYGEYLEVDKSLLDAVSEPLLHLIRNSVDHGIESAALRKAAEKPEVGTVAIAAWQRADRVFIEISDDGAGIDTERVREKAITAGLITADDELSEQEISELIFHAGLSTAAEVTEVSGRGIGMDVVRESIRAIGGDVHIRSEPGRYSAFTVSLPARLAVLDGLLVSESGHCYIIPTQSVARTIRPQASELSRIQGKGQMLRLPEAIVPIVRFNSYVGIENTRGITESACLIVRSERGPFGLVVDEIVGQRQFVVKPVHDVGGAIEGVMGGVVQGDGSMALVLDVDTVGNTLLGE